MLYFYFNADQQAVTEVVAHEYFEHKKQTQWARPFTTPGHKAPRSEWTSGWFSRNDIESFDDATFFAESLTKATGSLYIPTNRDGRDFDVIRAPQVGDLVSYAFNGDSYPCGKIVRISESLTRIATDSGKVFWRKKQTGAWLNGGWCMVSGHVEKRNPEF